ncbi:PDZ domain-containing protein [Phototrophicus methaneseepsis]|uniref:PDZ domain-containing protein n=1 Tax=Phototrophicus methaneseepsis TaxID=2710758 RepID=A0A7S8ID61_9CHLR|nr:S41 family peptidase [Phototrophicus methaneseepsis]QPC82230.1 PDZ domain-containing protein [Phototrophicus methaneseepsis]
MAYRKHLILVLLMFVLAVSVTVVSAIGEDDATTPPSDDEVAPGEMAPIVDDEGGPVVLHGTVTYTNPFFTSGVSQPLIILEDQAGFVDRNEYFLFPPESQVLGQITTNFYDSPFGYSLALPIEPQGSLRDVDNDDEQDTGVMVFAVAYWSNTFGDPLLEERDMYGGGWSGAYASTRTSTNPDLQGEYVGGQILVYAPDDEQGFPSGFGDDGLLFTDDDPIVTLPQGYTVVNMDTDPFTFDRSREQVLDLYEPEVSAVDDFSGMDYVEAFDAMVEKMRVEYAFSEYYDLDWDELSETYRPQVQAADASHDAYLFAMAIRDLLWEIPDGHVSMSLDLLIEDFQGETAGGLGIAIRELDDGRVIVNYLVPGTPAEEVGMELGTEIVAIDGTPIDEYLDNTFIWAHQALATEHAKRLQQLRYATRFEMGTTVEVTFINPGEEEQTVSMDVVPESDSFSFSSFNAGVTGIELPVEFEILPSGYGLVSIYSFSDDEYLTVQLWERMIETFKASGVPGIIIDMRNNGGGSGFLADQMSAYFFEEPIVVGNSGVYNEDYGDFYFDERGEDKLYLPPEELIYPGPVAVIVSPACFSACEFFSYNFTLRDDAAIVGFYPTGGLGGGVEDFYMPEGISIRFTVSRAVDPEDNIHIEGQGVAPTVTVPVTEENLFSEADVLLTAAEDALTEMVRGVTVDGGSLSFGSSYGTISATANVQPDTGVQYTVNLPAGALVSFFVEDADGTKDTYLAIYDETNTVLLADNDDMEDGSPNSALVELSVGDTSFPVVVEMRLKEGQEAGDLTLTIESVPEASQ